MSKRKPAFRLSIGTIFFGVMLMFAVVGGGVISIWRGYESYRQERQSVMDRDAMYAHTLSQGVRLFLSSAVTTVSTMARQAEVEPALDHASLQPLVERFAKQNVGAFISMYVIGPDGVEIADYFPAGKDDADRMAGVGVDLSDRAYMKTVMTERRPTVSDAVIGRSTKRAVVVVTSPVFDAAGNIVAVAAGSLDLAALDGLASRQIDHARQMPVVVDASGQAVLHRERAFVESLRDLRGTAPAAAALSGGSGVVASYHDPDGHEYSAAYRHVDDFGWGVWVARDSAQLSAAVADAAAAAAASFAVMLLFAGVAFAVTSRFLFLPLRRMAEQAERMGAGDFERKMDLSGTIPSLEVSLLAEKFAVMGKKLSDMTARLRRSNEELEKKVKERTRELEKLSEMKDEFLFRTVHDLRSPVTGIRLALDAYAEEHERAKAKPEMRQRFSAIQEACARVMRLIEDLLKVAQGEKVEATAKREVVDVVALVRDVLEQLKPVMDAKDVAARHDVPDARVRVMGDADAITEIFDNLVNNAVKYNREGGSVSVSYVAAGSTVQVMVADTGIGMNDATMEKLFSPYFRAGDSKEQGTGLGLYIVRKLAKNMGGDVTVTSAPGRGSRFTVSLPAA